MNSNFSVPWYNSFKYKLLMFSLVLAIVPLTVLGYITIYAAKSNLAKNIQYHNQVTSQRLASDLQSIIGGQIEKVETVAHTSGHQLFTASQQYRDGILYSLLKKAPYIEEISLVHIKGKELARASRRQVVGNKLYFKADEAFKNLKAQNLDWSQTFLDRYGQMRLKRIIPIYNVEHGNLKGGLIIEISLRRVVDRLSFKQPSQQGRVFIVDKNGKLIGHEDFSQVLKQRDVSTIPSIKKFIADNTSRFFSITQRYKSYDGQEVLGALTAIDNLGWAVIQEVPITEAFLPIKMLLRQLLFAGFVLIVLTSTVSAFFGIRFSNSIRILEKGVRQIRNNDLEYEIKVEGNDELSHLGDTINLMRKEIRTRRQQEQALQQAEKLSSLGLLASGVAHEINNPVGVISAYTEDLLDRLEEENYKVKDGELRYYLKVILKQSRRCKQIVGNLLNFARRSKSEPEFLNIKEVVGETLSLVQYRIEKEGITTRVNIPADIPEISASPGEVQQVLINIITNALDAMKPGGTLNISAYRKNNKLILSISDTGCGIEPRVIPKIYDPFYTTKEAGKGTGLGLSICYGIITKLGGDIQIKSTPGKGTTVRIVFPIMEEDQGE